MVEKFIRIGTLHQKRRREGPEVQDSMRWCERYRNNTFAPDADVDAGMDMWTDEQMSIINSDSDRVIVQAFAGTGKTSTLSSTCAGTRTNRCCTSRSTRARGVCDAKEEGLGLKNISVSTTHAFALDYLKSKNMLSDNVVVGSVKCKDLVAKGYDRVTANDILSYCVRIARLSVASLYMEYNEGFKKVLVEHTKKLWDSMFDGRMKMSHDVYFKYQSMKPVLNYDVILVDEIQDSLRVRWT